MTRRIVTFRNSAKASKKLSIVIIYLLQEIKGIFLLNAAP